MQWARSRYISMFLWKEFLMGWITKIQKHKEERNRSGKNFKRKRRGKNGGKKKKKYFLLRTWRFPYSCVLHQSGTPFGLPPSCNPPLWEPPLQPKAYPYIHPFNTVCHLRCHLDFHLTDLTLGVNAL